MDTDPALEALAKTFNEDQGREFARASRLLAMQCLEAGLGADISSGAEASQVIAEKLGLNIGDEAALEQFSELGKALNSGDIGPSLKPAVEAVMDIIVSNPGIQIVEHREAMIAATESYFNSPGAAEKFVAAFMLGFELQRQDADYKECAAAGIEQIILDISAGVIVAPDLTPISLNNAESPSAGVY